MAAEDELLGYFVVEGRDLVASARRALAALSLRPDDGAQLESLFRDFHTLKGSAGLFDLPELTAMLHAAETALAASRSAGLLGHGRGAVATAAVDLTEAWLEVLEAGQGASRRLIGDTRAAGRRLELAAGAGEEGPGEPLRPEGGLRPGDAEAGVAEAVGAEAGVVLRSLRVDAARLDALAALVDELIIAKNALLVQAADGGAAASGAARLALERVTSELHAEVMEMRLTPVGQLFARFPRRVREIAAELGKQVEFATGGDDVVVDKAVVEGLFTPLLHLVRNALDHGVEPPADRRAAGKPESARLTLWARAQGEAVTIAFADDGRGIDLGRVREAAAARGLLPAAEAAGLADEQAAMLVFAPGFSTRREVTDLSGRGVGMDAVRAAATALGGHVSLDNRPGEGLAVRLTLPARLVLTKVLVVEAAGQRLGVPLQAVAETHQVRLDELSRVRRGRAFVRRDQVIPLLRLSELLGLCAPEPPTFPTLTVECAGEMVGLAVDAIAGWLEAPLRPMAGLLGAVPGVLGSVLEADGRVLLVLDPASLAAEPAVAA